MSHYRRVRRRFFRSADSAVRVLVVRRCFRADKAVRAPSAVSLRLTITCPMKLLSRFLVVLAGVGIGLAIGFALRGKAAGRLAESPAIMLASPTVSQAEL